ncbi:hypothetical protein GCM10007301_32680 [Azorhizobium oxalatiphilum]|uniref:Crotonobetainyl-CoA--carnitine CoA-transferase n=2 Tax=Azorhizobium oxalatiphilum TaxID=980631 RepID=A0A917C4X8_9HYPH|nr:hypothetical protein GCM10007301_32680 [Azorhizobium oxalatiphilum]
MVANYPSGLNKSVDQFALEATGHDNERRQTLRDLHAGLMGQIPTSVWNKTSAMLFADRITLSRLMYFNDRYKEIVGTTGVICEFGTLYGGTLSTLINLRGMYEPYNYLRRIVGFDTFSGFTDDLSDVERESGLHAGGYATPSGYERELERVLAAHEQNSPISHLRKFELVKGDVTETFDTWLEVNPSAVISMAIFDMDAYAPTKHVLERILERMPKGSLLCFDELNYPNFPGETVAVREVLGLHNLRLRHDPNNTTMSWCVVE